MNSFNLRGLIFSIPVTFAIQLLGVKSLDNDIGLIAIAVIAILALPWSLLPVLLYVIVALNKADSSSIPYGMIVFLVSVFIIIGAHINASFIFKSKH